MCCSPCSYLVFISVSFVVSLCFSSFFLHFPFLFFFFFFFNDTATTEIYTLSLHDALPILRSNRNRFNHQFHDQCDHSIIDINCRSCFLWTSFTKTAIFWCAYWLCRLFFVNFDRSSDKRPAKLSVRFARSCCLCFLCHQHQLGQEIPV